MSLDNLVLIKEIDGGTASKVCLYSDKATNHNYAVKKKEIVDDTILEYINKEIDILKQLEHPNVVKFIEYKQFPTYFNLVMEYYNYNNLQVNLDNYIKTYKKPFDEKLVQYLMKQIVSGIKYLHDKNIVHRNISLPNIVLDLDLEKEEFSENLFNSKVKIVDFGISRYLSKSELAYSIAGTPLYMDPIILKKLNMKEENSKKVGYDRKCDIWSLGVMCYQMLTGKNPFDMNEFVKKMEEGYYFLPTNISEETLSFINGMLQYDSKKRYDIDDLCKHDFITKPFSEFTKIDCNKYSQNIIDNKIKMNIKDKQIEQNEKDLKKKELEEKIISLEKELKEEKSKNEIYLKVIKQLNDDLDKYKKNDLADKNLEKDKTEELKKILDLNPDELLKGEKLISVNFTTTDEKMHYSIICKSTDIFSKIEDQFYNDNPKYNKNENIFMIGNKKIENSKTLDDNDIHNNSIIILKKSEI
jgi:serine/threonine protein kinase